MYVKQNLLNKIYVSAQVKLKPSVTQKLTENYEKMTELQT